MGAGCSESRGPKGSSKEETKSGETYLKRHVAYTALASMHPHFLPARGVHTSLPTILQLLALPSPTPLRGSRSQKPSAEPQVREEKETSSLGAEDSETFNAVAGFRLRARRCRRGCFFRSGLFVSPSHPHPHPQSYPEPALVTFLLWAQAQYSWLQTKEFWGPGERRFTRPVLQQKA